MKKEPVEIPLSNPRFKLLVWEDKVSIIEPGDFRIGTVERIPRLVIDSCNLMDIINILECCTTSLMEVYVTLSRAFDEDIVCLIASYLWEQRYIDSWIRLHKEKAFYDRFKIIGTCENSRWAWDSKNNVAVYRDSPTSEKGLKSFLDDPKNLLTILGPMQRGLIMIDSCSEQDKNTIPISDKLSEYPDLNYCMYLLAKVLEANMVYAGFPAPKIVANLNKANMTLAFGIERSTKDCSIIYNLLSGNVQIRGDGCGIPLTSPPMARRVLNEEDDFYGVSLYQANGEKRNIVDLNKELFIKIKAFQIRTANYILTT